MGVTTNLALNKTATSSSCVFPYAASRAVNGTLTPVSRWLCNTLPGWMSVDLGAYYWINRWVVRHMSVAGWKLPDYNMTDFKLQGSNDNRNWYDLDLVVGSTASITDRTITAAEVRYVRVYVTKGLRCNPKLASIMEFEVYPAPSSQFLSGLTLSSGTLSPTPFAGRTTFAYTASVGYDVTSIAVTPVAEDAHAIIRVNNVVVPNNQASAPINLNVGSNTITVQVTGSDGSAQATYTITVTRASSSSSYLTNLIASVEGGAQIPLSPSPFDKNTLGYSASVGYDVISATVTPTAEDQTATITVGGINVASGQPSAPINLNIGTNPISVVVTPTSGGSAHTYTVTLTRAESPYLSALVLVSGSDGSTIALNPAFSKKVFSYNATATSSSVKVIPTAESITATITVKGILVASGAYSQSIKLVTGDNSIPVVVTLPGGITQTYTLIVRK